MNASAPRRLVRLRVWRLFVEAGWSIHRVQAWLKSMGIMPTALRHQVEDLIREEWRRRAAK